jgi:hypothetical protein
MSKKIFYLLAFSLMLMAALAGCSSDSNSTTPSTNPPNAPAGLSANQSLRTTVTVSWTDVADEDTFVVARSGDSLNWIPLSSVLANVVTYNDATVLANRMYWYKVKAVNENGSSAYTVPASIWSWPAIFDFSSDQTGSFVSAAVGGGTLHQTWTLDNGAGKLTITNPTGDYIASLVSTDSMSNSGWFEAKIKIGQWYMQAGQDPSELGFFVERDPAVATDNVVGIIFNRDSTRFGYYYTGGGASMRRLAENPTVPVLTENAWHTVRFLHRGATWKLYVDGTLVWNGEIPGVAEGSYKLIQEWQFDKGDGPDNQSVWLDEVASNDAAPALRAHHTGFMPAPAKKK